MADQTSPGSAGLGTFRVPDGTLDVRFNPATPGGWAEGVTETGLTVAVRDAAGAVAFGTVQVDVTRAAALGFEVTAGLTAASTDTDAFDLPLTDANADNMLVAIVTHQRNFWLVSQPTGLGFIQLATNRMVSVWRRCFADVVVDAATSGAIFPFEKIETTFSGDWRGIAMTVRSPATWGAPVTVENNALVLPSHSGLPAGSLMIGQWTYAGGSGDAQLSDPEGIFGAPPAAAGYLRAAPSTEIGLALAIWEHDGRASSYAPALTNAGFGRSAVTAFPPL